MLRVWGQKLTTAEATTSSGVLQGFIAPDNRLIRVIKIGIIGHAAQFNYAQAIVHDSTTAVFASSSTVPMSSIFSPGKYGIKIVHFYFDTATPLVVGDQYFVRLYLDGYTYSDASHVALLKDFPTEIYPKDPAPEMKDLGAQPCVIELFTAEIS